MGAQTVGFMKPFGFNRTAGKHTKALAGDG
jgi:hypothetical protein